MNASQVIELAEKNIGKGAMVSSAELCLADARELLAKGEVGYAYIRACKSLQYSVGMFHADYVAAVG